MGKGSPLRSEEALRIIMNNLKRCNSLQSGNYTNLITH